MSQSIAAGLEAASSRGLSLSGRQEAPPLLKTELNSLLVTGRNHAVHQFTYTPLSGPCLFASQGRCS